VKVLVDTSVWSEALRRRRGTPTLASTELSRLIRQRRAEIIGLVRQELLSGIKSAAEFQSLKGHLRGFPDLQLETDDFELAAEFLNRCRARGIQGSNIDFLVCAAADRRSHSVFTTDRDFALFAKVIPVLLHVRGS
jgi:predicted nucleic acid-binding protein